MNEEIEAYPENYPAEIKTLFIHLRGLIYEAASGEITETLWAKLPSFYRGEKFVRLISFRDHINVEASGISAAAADFSGYKLTPKRMLQLSPTRKIPAEALKKAFMLALG